MQQQYSINTLVCIFSGVSVRSETLALKLSEFIERSLQDGSSNSAYDEFLRWHRAELEGTKQRAMAQTLPQETRAMLLDIIKNIEDRLSQLHILLQTPVSGGK